MRILKVTDADYEHIRYVLTGHVRHTKSSRSIAVLARTDGALVVPDAPRFVRAWPCPSSPALPVADEPVAGVADRAVERR